MSAYTAESALLAAYDPEVHSDDWPIFNLSAVEVFDATTSTYEPSDFTSLLRADLETPLRIRGKLNSISRDQAHLKLRPSKGTELLELDHVRQFAYGQYDDGAIDLWAAGRAGWYALRPSRAYKSIFDNMLQAIELLYFLADSYRSDAGGTKSRKAKRRDVVLTAEQVFANYAVNNHLHGEEAAQRIFEKHAGFLVKSMVKGSEGIEWKNTSMWAWMQDTRPDLFEAKRPLSESKIRQESGQGERGTKRKRSDRYDARQSSASTTHDSIGAATNRGRKSLRLSTDPQTPTVDSDATSIDEIVARPQRGHKGKSVLRPSTTKFVPLQIDDSEHLGDNYAIPAKPAIHSSSPAVKAAVRSRLLDAMVGAHEDEGIDMSLDNSDQDDESQDELFLPPITPGQSAIPVRLRKEDMQATMEGDTWLCPLAGCMHKVYEASRPASQSLIMAHFKLHVVDHDLETRVELVKRYQGPGQPVSRLLGRIQQMADKQGLPMPITRRY